MSDEARRWLELSVRCSSGAGLPGQIDELLVEGLLALGGRAAEERDGWIVTHLPEPQDLSSFMEEARGVLRALTGLGAIETRAGWREHEDWSETWKRGLAPRRITERILVQPSWLPSPRDPAPATIVLDPGMAFGTAEHGTTRGCLRLLDRAVKAGDHVFDVGSGSGILAIASVLLGASSCVAFEADALACEALRENVARNGVARRVSCVEGRVDRDDLVGRAPASGVVANIESGVLTHLLPGLSGALRAGGWLVLSGILEREWPTMRGEAERSGLRFVALDEDGEWRSGLFERRADGPVTYL